MGAQRLGPRKTRRIAQATGLDLVAVIGHGSYTHHIITTDHRHGWYNITTGDITWHDPNDRPFHYTSCSDEFFPDFDGTWEHMQWLARTGQVEQLVKWMDNHPHHAEAWPDPPG